MAKRIVLLSALVAVFVWGQTVPAAAETGWTSSDFKVRHAVADIGPGATVTLEGTVDRDIPGLPQIEVRPVVDLLESCASVTNPTETINVTGTASRIANPFETTIVVPAGQLGRHLDWTVTVTFVPEVLAHTSFCPSGYISMGPESVTGMRLLIWPGFFGTTPLFTKQGERLFIALTFPFGHTEF